MEQNKQLYKLPEGWIWTKLENVSKVITDGTHSTPNYIEKGVPFISIANIKPFEPISFDKYLKFISEEEHKELCKRAKPEYDDILFPRIGTLGYAKRIDVNYELSIFVGLGLVKLFKQYILPKYIEYYMNAPFVNIYSFKNATGSSRLTLPLKASRVLPVPLPPIMEQHRIVSKIESLFSELDHAKRGLKKAQQQLEAYRQALLKSAFEGKLTLNWRSDNKHYNANAELSDIKISRKNKYTEILNEGKIKNPKTDFNFKYKEDDVIPTWSIAKLENLIGINARIGWRGLTKKEYTKEGALFLSVHGLNYGKNVVFDEANHISIDRYNESPEIKLEVDDILLCKDGAGIGKVGIIKQLPNIATVNSSLLVIKAKEVFNPDFLYYFFYGPSMQRLVNEKISGSAIPHLFQKDIKEFNLKVPPMKEQEQIVKILESRFTLIENLEKSIQRSLKDVLIFKQSILKKAFEGKLIVQDNTDEPANLLLHKIRIEKSEYLKAQKELDKIKPQKKRQMDKKKTVLEILKESKEPISTQELWTNSIHEGDIESFYSEIKEIYDQLDEIKESTESLLNLKK